MQCMKCGRDAETGQVFCPACLASAERAPVKPVSRVPIPERPVKPRSVPVKQEKPEEIILKLHKTIRRLWIAVGCLICTAAVLAGLIGYHYLTTEHGGPAIGSNYSTEGSSDGPHIR